MQILLFGPQLAGFEPSKAYRFLYVPPGITLKNSTWCSLCVECFVHISELTATFASYIISRYSDWLRAGRSGIESRWGRDFLPVQTGPGAHPASCTMGTGSFPGVKRPGRGVDHPPPSSAEVKERVGLYLYSPMGLHSLFWGEL